jgi:hypothetical protein
LGLGFAVSFFGPPCPIFSAIAEKMGQGVAELKKKTGTQNARSKEQKTRDEK